jgi:hypothetical protein
MNLIPRHVALPCNYGALAMRERDVNNIRGALTQSDVGNQKIDAHVGLEESERGEPVRRLERDMAVSNQDVPYITPCLPRRAAERIAAPNSQAMTAFGGAQFANRYWQL